MNDSPNHGKHFGLHQMRRANLFDPKEIIDFLDIKDGESVLDLGGGDGFFAKEILKRTKNVSMIDLYDGNFSELQALGIKTIKGDICHYNCDSYDLVYISNVYHDIVHSCRDSVYENIPKISKRRVAVLDFKPGFTTFGPPQWLRLPEENVIKDFESMGFKLSRKRELKTHYLLLFEK